MKNKFLIKCSNCKWTYPTDGSKESLKELIETTGCTKCTKRKFRCIKCGYTASMHKVS
jgi:hypothetical protein